MVQYPCNNSLIFKLFIQFYHISNGIFPNRQIDHVFYTPFLPLERTAFKASIAAGCIYKGF